MLITTGNKPETIWRNGERWSLSDDKTEYVRLLDIAPHMEDRWMMEHQEIIRRVSEGYNSPNKERWHAPVEPDKHPPTGLNNPVK